jgi:type II secretory pathway predicted ATPase ExeA
MYTEFYGFTTKPFENTPDPKYFFPSKSHREVLASLRYGVDTAKGFILITGDIGTGKTTAIQVLLKHINPEYIVFNIIHPKWRFNELIGHFAKKLGVSPDGKGNFEILEAIQDKLEALDKAGRRFILIIDEAHLLSEDILEDIRLLSNIENDRRKLLQIVLVGQKEIHKTLQKRALQTLKQRIVINRNLEPLDIKETELYIKHRLRIAGRQSQLFIKRALILIWKRSRGVPRLINQICDNALLIGFALDSPLIGIKEIKEVIKDMDFGQKSHRTSLFVQSVKLNFQSLKWLGAVVATLLLILALADDFLIDRFDSSNVVSQKETISQKQNPESIVRGAIHNIKTHKTRVPSKKESSATDVIPHNGRSKIEVKKASVDNETKANLRPQNVAGLSGKLQNLPLARQIEPKIYEKSTKSDFTKRVVKAGESLTKIARETYGVSNNTVIDLIHMANPAIKNINRIIAGQTIILPLIEKEDLIVSDEKGSYYIHYASFYNFEKAIQSVKELMDKNEKRFIIRTLQQENEVYRVYCGIFKSREEAQKELETLKLEYFPFIKS